MGQAHHGGPANKKPEYRTTDRLTTEEVYAIIDEGTHLTFDYLLNTFYAAMIAAVGLASDSAPTVVASMLISPLMGPIMGLTFGAAVRDWGLMRRCAKNELIGGALTVGTGMLVGAVLAQFWGPYCENYSMNPGHWCFGAELQSDEMISRGKASGLIGGLFIALPAGGAGALALMGGGNGALVGVAIAVALLPPLTNSGILLAMSIVYYFQPPVVLTHQERHEFSLCFYSFLLFCLNFTCIFVMAYAMFKLKRIHKLPLRSAKWRRESRKLDNRITSDTATLSTSPLDRSNRSRRHSDHDLQQLLSGSSENPLQDYVNFGSAQSQVSPRSDYALASPRERNTTADSFNSSLKGSTRSTAAKPGSTRSNNGRPRSHSSSRLAHYDVSQASDVKPEPDLTKSVPALDVVRTKK